jgi:hypothetical protein
MSCGNCRGIGPQRATDRQCAREFEIATRRPYRRERNSGEPVERPLQLVAPDRGGVYLDKRPAGLERGHVDRFVAASTPGMWSRIASIVRGPATSGSTLWTDRIRAGKGYSGTGNGEIVTTRLNSVAFIVVEASC